MKDMIINHMYKDIILYIIDDNNNFGDFGFSFLISVFKAVCRKIFNQTEE
jgi:hypothetical protein